MSKKAVYGILVALLLPLIGYFALKQATEGAVVLPRHYLPDSVVTRTKNGKQYYDTIWHTLPDFSLTNQLGQQVSWKDLEGKIVVADFFFTHCPTICPGMTNNMKKLQDGIKNSDKAGNRDADFIQFLSFSIDPERDSVAQLKKWADRFQIDPQNWWLLTGDRKAIYDLSINDMKLLAQDGGPVDSNFLHTDFFVLIDKNRNIRGYYHGLDTNALSRLSEDVILLTLEKDPKRKFFLAGKLELIAVVFVIAAIGIVVLMNVLKREDKKA
ncbi:MAG TPA: SCO family protein [Flavisolibacter sp.]|nr:SCO family protein [Flavisolibacter sp.]